MAQTDKSYPAHNIIEIDNVTFSSNFDNGNLLMAEKRKHMEYNIWSACDNQNTPHETKHCTWFYFTVTGLPQGSTVKFNVMNQQRNGGLYKFDHRPVYKCNSTGNKWGRIRSACKFSKNDEYPLTFEHQVADNGTLHFAFTYPYTYTMVQDDLNAFNGHINVMDKPDSIFYQRELLTNSPDGLRIDFVTITSVDGATQEQESLLSGLFPDNLGPEAAARPPIFADKQIFFISARVHSGEVPAQHTFKGIFDFLMDPHDLRAIEMRRRYVFKLIPILNPDGVYRGHFRCDQYGNNLNRHYAEPDSKLHPSIYAVKHLQEYYSQNIAMYLDLHAHASKRGCFIYGNVLDSFEQQVQNQLYCKLIAMNTAHFDYEGCLFSRDHMQRVDPGDRSSGLTAEGSGRVSTYLSHKLIHSYTLECNYNCSKFQNEVVPTEKPCRGKNVNPPSAFSNTSERYTPSIWEGVGRACMVAMLDLRGHNPCSRLPMTRVKSLERIRLTVMGEVRQKAEYKGVQLLGGGGGSRYRRSGSGGSASTESEEIPWVHRTDAVFVPTPKVERSISLPKVQQPDAPKPKRLPKEREKVISRAESLKMKQAAISLPAHIDAYTGPSTSACANQYPVQQHQQQPQPPGPVLNCTNATTNGSQSLKYKRFFNSKENNSNVAKDVNSNSCRGLGKSDLQLVGVTPAPPPDHNQNQHPPHKREIVPATTSTTATVGVVKQLDGLSSLPLSPPKDQDTGVSTSDSQQSLCIQAPQIQFQAPSPPNVADLNIQQEKTAIQLPENVKALPVSHNKSSKAENMLSSTDSKEFLPEKIMQQIYKPLKTEKFSKIPKGVRKQKQTRENQFMLASNE